ncbi:MAG: hypothetical protein L6R42_005127 [Xanthoria sp. 1 TBL-2021]|nr:MAG: hypothetical protein L6R42_005127 [Xanthoria sp. 1 TBL-2021]
MSRPRRSVQFQHRGSNGHHGRRPSISETSEGVSEPGSPGPRTMNGNSESTQLTMSPSTLQKEPKPQSDYEKKKETFITRTIWTFVMIAGFFAAMFAGHIYILAIVTAVQIVSFKEVIAIANVPSRAKNLPFTRSLNWYFLGTTMYFLYGESVIYYFKHIVLVDRILLPFATHHRFISFMLYVMGFVFFVGSLQKGHYRFQFTQFAWTHMALYLINVQSHFIMNNTLEGMIWFFLPASLVITNDIFAYICGITFGRTQLIKLSPKKTVEGFVGAWILTILFGFAMTNVLMRYKYFICPANDLGSNFFTGLHCEPNPVFLPQEFTFQPPLLLHSPPRTFHIAPMQFHILVFASFASLIAPFGGFFASGLKRTFKVKDFGESIPGHGGITDRMDCQFIMGFFAFMYYQSFIAEYRASVGGVIETAIQGLSAEEQIEVVRGLTKYLVGQGQVGDGVLECLAGVLPRRR